MPEDNRASIDVDPLLRALNGRPMVAPQVAHDLVSRAGIVATRRELDGAMAALGYEVGWLVRIEFYVRPQPPRR